MLMESSSEGKKELARTRTPLHSAAQHKGCIKVWISVDDHILTAPSVELVSKPSVLVLELEMSVLRIVNPTNWSGPF